MGHIHGPSTKPPYSILWPSHEMLALTLLRTIIGLVTGVVTKITMKYVSCAAFRGLVQMRKGKEADATLFIKLSSKLFTYTTIGFHVNFLAPIIFRRLNIERPTFYTEI